MAKREVISPETILKSVTVVHKVGKCEIATKFKNVRMVYRGNRRNGVTIMSAANEKAIARFDFVNNLTYVF